MKIKRSTIIKAIRDNELHRGLYFGHEDISDDPRTCEVCAVGAIIRDVIKSKDLSYLITVTNFLTRGGLSIGDHPEEVSDLIQDLLSEEQYFNAISVKFESLGKGKLCTEKQKQKLIEFVKKNIPTTISVYVPGPHDLTQF